VPEGILRWSKPSVWGNPERVLTLGLFLTAVFLGTWLVTGKIYLAFLPLGCLMLAVSPLFASEIVQLDETGIHWWRGHSYHFIPWSRVKSWEISPHGFAISSRPLGVIGRYLFATRFPPLKNPEGLRKLLAVVAPGRENTFPVPGSSRAETPALKLSAFSPGRSHSKI
jgi:hypothetical protein